MPHTSRSDRFAPRSHRTVAHDDGTDWLDGRYHSAGDNRPPGLLTVARPQFARRVEMAFRWTNRGVYWIRRLQLVIEKLGIRRYERVDA